jgi:hypothetical protein
MTIISNLPALSTATDGVIFPVVSGASTNKATFLQFRQYLGVVDISTSTLRNGSYTVTLGEDGSLSFPDTGLIDDNGGVFRIKSTNTDGVQLGSTDDQNYVTVTTNNVTIQTNSDALNGLTQYNWIFGTDGTATFPDDSIQTTAWTGTVAYSNVTGTPSPYNLPTASTSTLGGVKVDGVTITINSSTGIITGANTYNLPIASTSTLGGVKIGPDSGLSILEDGSLSVTNQGGAVITGTIVIENITQSTSTNTGAFQVYGGIGIGGDVYVGGLVNATTATVQDLNVTGTVTGITAGVSAITAGTGISINTTTGNVTVTNSGVTSITAGSNVSITASTGNITISATGGGGGGGNLDFGTILSPEGFTLDLGSI